MKSVVKWMAIAAAALVLVIIGTLLIIPSFIDINTYKPEFERFVSEATGRQFSLGGDVRLSLFPWAGASFSDMKLGNPPGFAEEHFLTLQWCEVRVRLLPLLYKQLEVDRVVLQNPRGFLVINKDGRVNWDFGSKPGKAEPGAAPDAFPSSTIPSISALMIDGVSIQNGQVMLIDHIKSSRRHLEGLNLSLTDLSLEKPARFSLSASMDRKPISADGHFGPVGPTLGRDAVPLEVRAEVFGQAKLRLTGSAHNLAAAPAANVIVEVAEFSPRRLLAEIGQAIPLANTKVLERLTLRAIVEADAKTVAVTDGILNLDDSRLNFSLKASDFAKPNITFDLNIDHIDLDSYLFLTKPKTSSASLLSPASTEDTQSRSKTDYTPLRQIVMNGRAQIGKLTVKHVRAEDIHLNIAAKNGLLSLNPVSMKLYQGAATGKTIVNVRGDRPTMEIQLTLENVQANPMLKDIASITFFEGTAQAQMALSMSVDKPEHIKRTLDGRGSLVFSDGAIVGVDLAGMFRNVKALLGGKIESGPKPRTDFSELLVPFTIDKGVFHTAETSLKSPLLRLTAAGKADLVKETLDFRIDPKLVGTIKGQGDEKKRSGLRVPIIVTGSFGQPIFLPDAKAMAKGGIKKGLGLLNPGNVKTKKKASGLFRELLPKKD